MPRRFLRLALLTIAVWFGFTASVSVFAAHSATESVMSVPAPMLAPTPTPPARRRVPPPPPPQRDHPPALSPKELLARCGWSAGTHTPTPWQNAKVFVEVPASVPVNSSVTVIVRFQSPSSKTAQTIQPKLALCPSSLPVQVVGQRSWDVSIAPGQSISKTATVRFTQIGVFDLYVGGYDLTTGQITGGVRRIRVNSPAKAASPSDANWELIASQGFEEVFPAASWMVLDRSDDGYERYWDDAIYWDGAAYRAHAGYWAAWPARGGADGYSPSVNNNYSDNMDTRMIYGPFDLSATVYAESGYVRFWLWKDVEPCCDWIALQASHTGSDGDFQEIARWTGSSGGNWEQVEGWLNDYVGDNSVWLAWRFYSDYSIMGEGPWVDDIEIWRYVNTPGQVTVQGTFSYIDRDGVTSKPARFTKAYLYDWDADGNHDFLAGPIVTDGNGFFQFPSMTNWDSDDPDPDPSNRRLDMYVIWVADVDDATNARRRVTDFNNQSYAWGLLSADVQDGLVDLSSIMPIAGANVEAMWIFQDMRRAWEYVRYNSNPVTDPGSASAKWESQQDCLPVPFLCSSLFYAGEGGTFVFVSHQHRLSSDVVIHEVGHHYLYNQTGWWLFWDLGCYDHNPFSQESPQCAWSEGWADFFALAVNSTLNPTDACLDWRIGPCGADLGAFENLETPTWGDGRPQGDIVEGRVAGALYDLWDGNNESMYDSATFFFAPIWNILHAAPHETALLEFWNSWMFSANNKHNAVRAIYQNTIDYDNAPVIAGLPDITMQQSSVWNNAIDLWPYSYDTESTKPELGWQITSVTDSRCGITLDGRYLDLAPQAGWQGSCDATISVSDSLKANVDTFRLTVESTQRLFLPIIEKH